jgi:hypothetical protein
VTGERVRREAIAEKAEKARWQRLDEYLATLTENEQTAFQAVAIAGDRGFLRERWRVADGNPELRKDDLRLMLRNHLEKSGADQKPAERAA